MRKQLITIHQKNEPSRTQGLRVCALQYALTFIRFILSAEFFFVDILYFLNVFKERRYID